MSDLVVIVVFSPADAAPKIRKALADAGVGQLGEYRACTFSASGIGRFEPSLKANPTIGTPGEPEEVAEQRIECVCKRSKARAALEAMLAAHPYEEPAYHVYPIMTLEDF